MKGLIRMSNPYIDLHIHSTHSDGSMTPGAIVEAAAEVGVGVLAIADHGVIGGYLDAREACERRCIRLIPAVEIEALDGRRSFHILAYGFDPDNQPFLDFLSHMRFLLDEMSVKLIEAMQGDYPALSFADYMGYTHDASLGGWKALSYLLTKGVTNSLKEGIRFYPEYGITYDKAGFSSIEHIAWYIHRAGGYAVLAHPGDHGLNEEPAAFEAEMHRLIGCGLDGIECYYPRHSEAVMQVCLKVCRDLDLLITAGSDCHGTFGGRPVGEMETPLEWVSLKGLIE